MLNLRAATPPAWIEAVLENFDAFLIDHAACERKASATGLQFVVRYPDRAELVETMIALAIEELEHFQQVYRLLATRNLRLTRDEKDPYVNLLLDGVRHGAEERLLDRLIVSGIIEARGCERFGLLAAALPAGDLKDFYVSLSSAEARHHAIFLTLARRYFDAGTVAARLEELLDAEAAAMARVPLRAALH